MTDLLTAIQVKRPLTKPTREEEADMLALAQNGDKDAIEQLIRNYVGLLINETNRLVKGATRVGVGDSSVTDDVISAGILAFMRAIDVWDPERGRFAGLVQRVLRNDPEFTSVINQVQALPIPQQTLIRRSQAMKAADGDVIRAREIAPQFGLTRETFDAVNNVFNTGTPFHAPNVNTSDGEYNGDQDSPNWTPPPLHHTERGYVRMEHQQDADRALAALDFVERMVVESHYGLNGQPEMSNYEIAASMGITRQAVSKRLKSAHNKMKAAMAAEENS